MPTVTPLNPALLPCTIGFLVLAPELILLITRLSRPASAARADHSSLLRLWITILTSILLAAPFGLFRSPASLSFELGSAGIVFVLGLLTAGVLLRWWAIHTLGKFFTVDVAVHHEHRLVTEGPYAWIRHPSYTGLLLELTALALTFQHAFGVLLIMVPTTAALLWRIAVEERALATGLGESYLHYLRHSYCLVPFVALRRRSQSATVMAADVIPIESALDAARPRRGRRAGKPVKAALPPSPATPQRDSHVA